MNLFEFLAIVLATFSLSVIFFFLFRVLFPPTVVVVEAEPPVRWWPWPITSYNHWPYWMSGGGAGGSGSGSGESVHHRPTREEHTRPWGGAQRGAHGGGFHHAPSAPPAPPAPSAPSAPSAPPAPSAPSAPPAPSHK